MKKVLTAVAAISCAVSYAQQTSDVLLEWGSSSSVINQHVTSVVDSLYTTAVPGQTVRITLLSMAEKLKPEEERALLSFKRAEELLAHFRSKNAMRGECEVEMVPFHQPNRLRASEITSRSYRNFMSRKSESYFLITRQLAQVTSVAQVYFDKSIKNELETFTIYASTDQYVTLKSGTVIYIPANTLKTENGSDPLCRDVEVRVAEYTRPEAMALKAMTTSSHGLRLESGGMWYVGFSCNGKTLTPAAGKYYYIRVPFEGEAKNMKVFLGDIKKNMIDWRLDGDGSVRALMAGQSNERMPELDAKNDSNEEEYSGEGDVLDGVYGEQYDGYYEQDMYELKLNDVGWINCDAFYEVEQKTDLLVNCDTTGHVNVMLVFAKRKSVLPGYVCANTTQIKFDDVPAGETALLVVFRKMKDNTLQKVVQPLILGEKSVVDATAWVSSTSDELRTEIYAKLSDF